MVKLISVHQVNQTLDLASVQFPVLPKWPEAFVTGKPVTPTQAKDIIFRTDLTYPSDWSISGNDRALRDRAMKLFGWTRLPESDWDVMRAWGKEMRVVETEYVYNRWFSSAYVNGPTGWCHPNGLISVRGHNYGKWPNVWELVCEWASLLEAFPYLDLVCTMFDKEHCEEGSQPVVTMVVKNAEVAVYEGDLSLHDSPREPVNHDEDVARLLAKLTGPRGEQGWPTGWMEEFAVLSNAAVDRVLTQGAKQEC